MSQLAEAIATPPRDRKPFVREFVRPHGIDRAATPLFVDAVERMSSLRVEPARADVLMPVWRWALRRVAALKDNERFERWTLSPREQMTAERRRAMREQKAIKRALSRAANDVERQQKLHEREAQFEASRRERQDLHARAAAERKASALHASERAR